MVAPGRFTFRIIILLLGAASVAMIPAGMVTQRWLVLRVDEIFVVNAGALQVAGTRETTFGLFQYCRSSPLIRDCSSYEFDPSAPEMLLPASCARSQDDLKFRLRAVIAFAIIALLLTLLLTVFCATVVHSYVVNQGEGELQTGLKCVVLALAAAASELISVAVYGGTISSWANCGSHYCDAGAQLFATDAPLTAPFPVNESVTYNCGFGLSFALSVVSCLILLAILVLELVDFATFPKVATKSAERDQLLDSNQKGSNTVESEAHKEREAAHTVEPVADRHESAEDSEPPRDAPISRQEFETAEETNSKIEVHSAEETRSKSPVVGSSDSTAPSFSRSVLLPEGDDWEFDAAENLYWSPSQQLFFDHSSGHFYDPVSGSWYNPNLQMWYQL